MRKLLGILLAAALFPASGWSQTSQSGAGGITAPPSLSGLDASAMMVTPTGATTARTLAARAADIANVLDFGADPTGTADSTSAFKAALATGRAVWAPTGTYAVSNMVTVSLGQKLYGDGRTKTILAVSSSTFNLSALGVVRLFSSTTASSGLFDVGFSFTQPDQGARASLVRFPPAIYARASSGFQLGRVRVSAANVCLDARGNTGQAWIDDFECGALTTGMLWGSPSGQSNAGALDFVHINGYHFWPFGLTHTTYLYPGVYRDGNTVAASFGEIQSLDSRGFDSFVGQVNFTSDASRGMYHFTTMMLDGDNANLNVAAAGFIQIGELYSSKTAAATATNFTVSGGKVYIGNIYYYGGTVNGAVAVTGGTLDIYGGSFYWNNTTVSAATISGGALKFTDTDLAGARARYAQPFIAQTGGTVALVGNTFSTGSTGVGISITSDNAANYVVHNLLAGWTMAVPPGALGRYGPNSNEYINYPSTSVGVGPGALANATSATTENTAIGYNALTAAGPGNGNTAVGHQALKTVTGEQNTAIGDNSGNSTGASNNNTFVGYASGLSATGGDLTGIGAASLRNATGNDNTALGYQSGQSISSGTNNLVLGFQVGSDTLTTGSNNILIGTGTATDAVSAGASNEVNIGGLLFWNTSSLAAPTVSSCGSGPAIDSHANNRSGMVTVGSGTVAACTVIFAGAGYSTWAHCRVTPHSTIAAFGYSYTRTVLTVTASSLTSDVFDYDCDGY